ncbi:MAG: PilN domain-containing protein [Gammaproteobacteria bacterium]
MAKINLLPWREELRKQQQQDFLMAIMGSAALCLLIMLMVHSHIEGLIEQQNRRNQFLETEIAALEAKIKEIDDLEQKKAMLVAKMEVIQELQGSRPEIVHLFDEVATTTPDGVYLTEMTQTGNTLTFDGSAQSNARVSAYMRNLDASPWLANPVLNIIETKGEGNQGRVNRFKLSVQQKKVDQPKFEGQS